MREPNPTRGTKRKRGKGGKEILPSLQMPSRRGGAKDQSRSEIKKEGISNVLQIPHPKRKGGVPRILSGEGARRLRAETTDNGRKYLWGKTLTGA